MCSLIPRFVVFYRCGEYIYDIVYVIGGQVHMLNARSRSNILRKNVQNHSFRKFNALA